MSIMGLIGNLIFKIETQNRSWNLETNILSETDKVLTSKSSKEQEKSALTTVNLTLTAVSSVITVVILAMSNKAFDSKF
jgi:hypothetical protein